MPTLAQLESQLRHQKHTTDLLHTQQTQKFAANRRKRDELEQYMVREVDAMKLAIASMQIGVDGMKPGTYDEQISVLNASVSALGEQLKSLQGQGAGALQLLAQATDKRLDAIDKLLTEYSAPRGMEKRLADADKRMDKLQGSIAHLERATEDDMMGDSILSRLSSLEAHFDE